jgi:hypothetical protein
MLLIQIAPQLARPAFLLMQPVRLGRKKLATSRDRKSRSESPRPKARCADEGVALFPS